MSSTIFLFWIVIAFGFLLLAYVGVSFNKTKQKVQQKEHQTSNGKKFLEWLKSRYNLWRYYFVNGNPNNTLRNTLIVFIGLMVVIALNGQLLNFNNQGVTVGYFLLVIFMVYKMGGKRNKKIFDETFPEVIQVLNSATTAGAGLLQAIERCGRDIKGSLGEEFKLIYRRLAIGEDVVSVFHDSYTRWPYKEFYFFIMIIRINLEKGGQMKEVISRLGRVIADSRKMEQKKKAMTSEARMSAMIVGAFPVLFFIFMKFKMPDNFDYVINDPTGNLVLYYVLGSEGLGMGIIYALMKKAT